MKSSQKRNRQISRRDNRRPEKAILHVQFENHRTVRLCSFLKNAVFRFAALQVLFGAENEASFPGANTNFASDESLAIVRRRRM